MLLRRALAVAVAALALVLTPAAGLAEGAPPWPNHFGLGVSAHPDDSGLYGWMPQSGAPWDYAYQYLAGGVNTGGGWRTWNERGQFPLWYAQGAAKQRTVPVFDY